LGSPDLHRAPLLLNSQSNVDEDGDGDSTIEESFRPLPERRRILAESSPYPDKSSLDTFLDALIFDAKKSTMEPNSMGDIVRKRRNRNRGSASQSVGSALDKKYALAPWHKLTGSATAQITGTATVASDTVSTNLSVNSHKSRSADGPKTDSLEESLPDVPMPAAKPTPIAWSRKSIPSRAHSFQGGGNDDSSSSVLASFLEMESKHGRPSSAHTVSGNQVASDGISISISDDGRSKTYTVGNQEAKIIEELLRTTHEVSPQKGKKSVTGWLEKAAANMQSPSKHGTIDTQASEIAESDRISSRSSMMVELSPQFQNNANTLKSYLEHKRSKTRRSGAFTVAGDRVSVRFQGKSTQELLELLDAEKRGMSSIQELLGPPLTANIRRSNSKSVTGAQHRRRVVERMKSVPNLGSRGVHQSTPTSFNAGADEADEVLDSARIFERSSSYNQAKKISTTRESIQSYLDRSSPKLSRRGRKAGGAHSIAGDRVESSSSPSSRKSRRKAGGAHSIAGDRAESSSLGSRKRRSSASRERTKRASAASSIMTPRTPRQSAILALDDSINNKDLDLEDFRPKSATRPMNRRTMLRKMQSVPILSDTNLIRSQPASPRRQRPSRTLELGELADMPTPRRQSSMRSQTKGKKKHRSNASATSNDSSKLSKSSQAKNGAKASPKTAHEKELDLEDLHKSFLDQFLDGDVDADDSASQLLSPQSSKQHHEKYKASLSDAPIENSIGLLRLEPEFLDSSQRMILQDPSKSASRRAMLTKMKSVPTMGSPSLALMDLYDSPKAEQKSVKTTNTGSKAKGRKKSRKSAGGENPPSDQSCKKSPGSGLKTPKSTKKKKGASTPKGSKTEAKATPKSKMVEEIPTADKPTLKDLPRERIDKAEDDKKLRLLANAGRIKKTRSLSNLDKRAYDVADRLLLVQRLNSLTNYASPSPDDGTGIKKPSSERIIRGQRLTPIRDRQPSTPSTRKSRASSKKTPFIVQSAPTRNKQLTNGHWSSVPRGLGASLASPTKDEATQASKPKSSRSGFSPFSRGSKAAASERYGFPLLPFGSSDTSEGNAKQSKASQPISDIGDGLDFASPPSKPVRKNSRQPDNLRETMRMSRWSSTPMRLGSAPSSPRKQQQHVRPVPVVIGEGSILDIAEDNTVCSDITDAFSLDVSEPEIHRSFMMAPNLDKIEEPSVDTSWGALSHSSKKSSKTEVTSSTQDKKRHLTSRWESSRDFTADGSGTPKTPTRRQETVEKTPQSKRFGWLKKILKK
jgi:hypothetical protein